MSATRVTIWLFLVSCNVSWDKASWGKRWRSLLWRLCLPCFSFATGFQSVVIVKKQGVQKEAHQFSLLLLLDDQKKLVLTGMAEHRSEQYVF